MARATKRIPDLKGIGKPSLKYPCSGAEIAKANSQTWTDPFPRMIRSSSMKLADFLGFGVGSLFVMNPFEVSGWLKIQS